MEKGKTYRWIFFSAVAMTFVWAFMVVLINNPNPTKENHSSTVTETSQCPDMLILTGEDGEPWIIARSHIQVVLPNGKGGSMVWHDDGCIHGAQEMPSEIVEMIWRIPTPSEPALDSLSNTI